MEKLRAARLRRATTAARCSGVGRRSVCQFQWECLRGTCRCLYQLRAIIPTSRIPYTHDECDLLTKPYDTGKLLQALVWAAKRKSPGILNADDHDVVPKRRNLEACLTAEAASVFAAGENAYLPLAAAHPGCS